jgi:thioredoxin
MKKDILILLVIIGAFAAVQSLNFVGVGTGGRAGPLLVQTTDETFQENLADSGDWVLVDFWAPWCGPCLQLKPTINKIAASNSDSLKVLAVNIDDAPGIADRFGVSSIPTLVLLYQGREIDRRIGGMPEPVMQEWITSSKQAYSTAAL